MSEAPPEGLGGEGETVSVEQPAREDGAVVTERSAEVGDVGSVHERQPSCGDGIVGAIVSRIVAPPTTVRRDRATGGRVSCHEMDPPPAHLDDHVLATLARSLADAVVVADASGTIVFWNEAAARVFGWGAAEAVGQTLDLIIPERQRSPHWDGYRTVMATGQTRYGSELLRVPALHRDGSRRSIAFTVTLLTDPAGAVSGIAAVVRDETRRWQEEQDLRRRVRELERPEASGATSLD